MTLWVALVVLVALSAFFSASETAFSSLNQIRLKSRAEDGDTSAARVLAMAEKYDKLLSTILIGNNIVNIAAASIGTIIFTKMLGAERGATVSTMVLTVVVLIFGEVTPKSLAKEMPETVATAVAPVLSLLMLVFTPLTWLFSQWKRFLGHFVHSTEEDTITEGELMTMVSEAENDGELTDRESELIRSAIEFDDVEVEEILTPRVDVIAVEDDLPLEEVAQTFAESGYSRLPVYHDTIDNIIGVVHEKDFYLARLKKEYGENAKGTRATLNARGAVIEINNIELYQGGNCMGVDSILGGNFSVQTKDFTKRTTSGATDVNQTQGLSESEKLENFKKEIWKEIDSMSWGSNISVQITNSAFEKMMVDKEFKNKMMNIIREDAHGSNMMCGGTLINIDENGYKGYSYMQDHTKEAGRAFDAHSKDKDSFYSKKCKKDELNELWERD